jgi:nucleoside-diphosphate-sugar epimerase
LPHKFSLKIFVTGGTGFIGGHFLKKAIADGSDVFALRRAESKTRIRLPQEPVWLEGNLEGDWPKELSQCVALVHLAAAGVSPQKATRAELFDVNVRQSAQLWRQAAKAGVKRFIICGSCFEYGKSGERYEFIPVDAPLEPANDYAQSKATATYLAMELAKTEQIELLVLRPFHVFGEGEEQSRLWPSLRKAALAGEDFPMTAGEQVRDFIPAEMVAEKFVAALARKDLRAGDPKIENVGTGKPQTLRAFAEHWWQQWNAKGQLKIGALPYRDNEVMRYVPKI